MIDVYSAVKVAHLLSAAVLFGTGLGIAYFMFAAWRSREPSAFAVTARHVVLADLVFTAAAVVAQPLTGFALIHLGGWPWNAPWLLASYALYAVAGACWLPVVWIQIRVARLSAAARGRGEVPGADVRRLMRIWFWLGWPAFAAVVGVYALMVAKPSF